jgi:hypothetical protein
MKKESELLINLDQVLTKEQIIEAFDNAYNRLINLTITTQKTNSSTNSTNGWGPREILAHIAGWASQATTFMPQVIAGIPPQTFYNENQHTAIDDTFNVSFITLIGNQSFEQILNIANQTHQDFKDMLLAQHENIFVPGNYLYERLKRVILHYLDHAQELEK